MLIWCLTCSPCLSVSLEQVYYFSFYHPPLRGLDNVKPLKYHQVWSGMVKTSLQLLLPLQYYVLQEIKTQCFILNSPLLGLHSQEYPWEKTDHT